MNKKRFVSRNLDALIEHDEDIRKYFEKGGSEEDKKALYDGLRQSLEDSYDHYASEYFEGKGLGSYFSGFLRYGGAAADTIGTYMFWTLGGAGFSFKAMGVGAKSLADAIDYRHYRRHRPKESLSDKLLNRDDLELAGEGLAERMAAYLPIGIGEMADLLRGTGKYDSKIVRRALYHAKNGFIKRYGSYEPVEKSNIIPLDGFRNPHYAGGEQMKKAA